MGFPVEPYIGEVFVYHLPAGRNGWIVWPDCEIAFVWDGLTWNRDDAATEQVREARGK